MSRALLRTFEISEEQVSYLGDMLKTGLYGGTLEEVVERLIDAGIRNAVERRHIRLKSFNEDGTVETQAPEWIDRRRR
jgi:hypothetical protein